MRLVTWNCCKGPFDRKVSQLMTLNFDVAVIQECPMPAVESSNILWFGDNPKQGVAVISGEGCQLEKLPLVPGIPRYVIPVGVKGPISFILYAVWTQPEPNYVEPILQAAEAYKDILLNQPSVIMGDFNSNACWDKKRKPARDHSAMVSHLADLGLKSSYHHFHKEEHGAETRHTIYFRWQEDNPFHIDYCFIPRNWLRNLERVEVGNYEEWKGYSDHRPLIVDLNL